MPRLLSVATVVSLLGALSVAVAGPGCAATVEVEGEGELGEGVVEGDGSGCVACTEGDCGLCYDPASNLLIYRCPTQVFPAGVEACTQTGSLFQEPGGEYYVCWRCGPL
ncbi:MAG: hypothetical protein IT373_31385 [Polyangiaceae bacterium]|nr:hypothetical protein [Polyangiaceae bacterium]